MSHRAHYFAKLVAIVPLAMAMYGAVAQRPAPEMVGAWTGDAEIAVNWTVRRILTVHLTIDSAGHVTGRVGDAELVGGQFHSNRGWLARALNWKTDFIVEGKLHGPIIAAEKVERDAVKIPLDWNGNGFTGGINSSGWIGGGKEHMVIAAARLVLRRETRRF